MKAPTNAIRPRRDSRLPGRLVTALAAVALIATTALSAGTPAAAAPTDSPSATGHGQAGDRPIVHRVPRVPITIDGRSVSPDTITRYNGQPLYMAALPEGRLAVFTRPADFERFVTGRGGPAHALAKPVRNVDPRTPGRGWGFVEAGKEATDPSLQEWPYTGSVLWEHMHLGGYGLWVEDGWGYADLSKVSMPCLFCGSYNDKASSVWASAVSYLFVWEHANYSGSMLWWPPGTTQNYLEAIGWNDRISSFASYR
ncbi:hypothetical protein Misp04_56600 [Micromonospora sp. NBRC 101691]|nr:hypothetical protein Misp04_56600 [Micromonospora sp. NBRC 101691]